MARRPTSLALLIAVATIVVACGSTTPTPAPSVASAPSASAAATETATATASAAAEATATPTPATAITGSAEPSAATATTAPTATPWKTYTSKRYKYSVKYPPLWVVTPGSAKLSDQIDDYSTHFVYLSRDTVSGTVSINLTVTHDVASFKSHYKAKLLSNKKVTVNGWPGRLLTFTGSDSGRPMYIQHLILGKGKIGYFIDMFSDRGSAPGDRALFKRIYKTFKPKS